MGALATKVRAKYPGAYDDLSDSALEAKITAKFPGTYDDLVTPQEPLRQATQAEQDKFVADEGSIGTRIRHNLPSRKTVADFVRPTLEGVGMGLGGVAGAFAAPETFGLSIPAGAAMGYAGGKGITDLIEGTPAKENLLQQFAATGNDVYTGAKMEATGMGVGKFVLEPGINAAAKLIRGGGPTNRATTKAAGLWDETHTAPNPELAMRQAATEAETQRVMGRIKGPDTPTSAPELQLTPGQATNNTRARLAEQSITAADNELSGVLTHNDAIVRGAAADNLTRTLGAGRELPAVADDMLTGEAQRTVLKNSITTSKQGVREAYGAVPEYPMPTDSFTTTAQALKGEFLHPEAQQALDTALTIFKSKPPTTKSLVAMDQYLSDEIRQAAKQGNDRVSKVLNMLKRGTEDGTLQGLKGDFAAMGEAAQVGDIALHQGKVVVPSRIKSEIDALTGQIKTAQSTGATLPEQNKHLFEYLAGKGEVVTQNVGISDTQYAKSLADRLAYLQRVKNVGAEYTPPAGGANQQVIENLQNGIASKQAILSDLQPAEDVAATYGAAHAKALAHFKQFGTDTIKSVASQGGQIGGGRLKLETIPARLFTQSGAKELVTALGPQQAAEQSRAHVTSLIVDKAGKADGTLDIQRAAAVIRQNRVALKTLGLTDHANQVMREQIPGAIRARLEAQGVDILGNPVMGAREAAKWAKQNAPAMRQAFGGGSKEIIAMQDFAKTMEILARRQNVTAVGGSTTFEKNSIENLFANAPKGSMGGRLWDALGTTLAGAGIGMLTGGSIGALEGGALGGMAKVGMNTVKQYQTDIAKELLKDAITNGETAKLLMDIARKGKVKPIDVHRAVKSLTGYVLTPQ